MIDFLEIYKGHLRKLWSSPLRPAHYLRTTALKIHILFNLVNNLPYITKIFKLKIALPRLGGAKRF